MFRNEHVEPRKEKEKQTNNKKKPINKKLLRLLHRIQWDDENEFLFILMVWFLTTLSHFMSHSMLYKEKACRYNLECKLIFYFKTKQNRNKGREISVNSTLLFVSSHLSLILFIYSRSCRHEAVITCFCLDKSFHLQLQQLEIFKEEI